jgi:hypothetical protein
MLWETAAITTGNPTILGIHIYNHHWESEPKTGNKPRARAVADKESNSQIQKLSKSSDNCKYQG